MSCSRITTPYLCFCLCPTINFTPFIKFFNLVKCFYKKIKPLQTKKVSDTHIHIRTLLKKKTKVKKCFHKMPLATPLTLAIFLPKNVVVFFHWLLTICCNITIWCAMKVDTWLLFWVMWHFSSIFVCIQ